MAKTFYEIYKEQYDSILAQKNALIASTDAMFQNDMRYGPYSTSAYGYTSLRSGVDDFEAQIDADIATLGALTSNSNIQKAIYNLGLLKAGVSYKGDYKSLSYILNQNIVATTFDMTSDCYEFANGLWTFRQIISTINYIYGIESSITDYSLIIDFNNIVVHFTSRIYFTSLSSTNVGEFLYAISLSDSNIISSYRIISDIVDLEYLSTTNSDFYGINYLINYLYSSYTAADTCCSSAISGGTSSNIEKYIYTFIDSLVMFCETTPYYIDVLKQAGYTVNSTTGTTPGVSTLTLLSTISTLKTQLLKYQTLLDQDTNIQLDFKTTLSDAQVVAMQNITDGIDAGEKRSDYVILWILYEEDQTTYQRKISQFFIQEDDKPDWVLFDYGTIKNSYIQMVLVPIDTNYLAKSTQLVASPLKKLYYLGQLIDNNSSIYTIEKIPNTILNAATVDETSEKIRNFVLDYNAETIKFYSYEDLVDLQIRVNLHSGSSMYEIAFTAVQNPTTRIVTLTVTGGIVITNRYVVEVFTESGSEYVLSKYFDTCSGVPADVFSAYTLGNNIRVYGRSLKLYCEGYRFEKIDCYKYNIVDNTLSPYYKEVTVKDYTGTAISTKIMDANHTELDLSEFRDGVYIVSIADTNKIQSVEIARGKYTISNEKHLVIYEYCGFKACYMQMVKDLLCKDIQCIEDIGNCECKSNQNDDTNKRLIINKMNALMFSIMAYINVERMRYKGMFIMDETRLGYVMFVGDMMSKLKAMTTECGCSATCTTCATTSNLLNTQTSSGSSCNCSN